MTTLKIDEQEVAPRVFDQFVAVGAALDEALEAATAALQSAGILPVMVLIVYQRPLAVALVDPERYFDAFPIAFLFPTGGSP